MPKSQTSNKQKTKKKLYLVLAIAFFVALLLGAAFAYNTYSNYRDTQLDQADRQRFETVHRSVSKLHQRLQKAAAPGVEWEMDTFCRKGSVKFQEPLRGCDVVTETEILVSSEQQARALMEKYLSLYNESKFFQLQRGYETNPPSFPNNLVPGLGGAVYKEKNTGMKCSASFVIEEGPASLMKISFRCDDFARELHYPLKS